MAFGFLDAALPGTTLAVLTVGCQGLVIYGALNFDDGPDDGPDDTDGWW